MAASIKRRLCHFVRLSSYVLKPPRNYLVIGLLTGSVKLLRPNGKVMAARTCSHVFLSNLRPQRLHTGRRNLAPFSPPNNGFHGSAPVQGGGAADGLPGFKDRPWDYLSSEGTSPSLGCG